MALKTEGLPFDVWDAWSKNAPNYAGREGCLKKWESFKGKGLTAGSIFWIARDNGWRKGEDTIEKMAKLPPLGI